MKWADIVSILSIALGGSAFLFSFGGATGMVAGGSAPSHSSSVIVVDNDGGAILLDSIVPANEVGVILVGANSAPSELDTLSPTSSLPLSSSSHGAVCVNINVADEKRLVSLKGIGPVLAANIVAYRKANGLFKKKADIQKVKGIGPSKYAQIADNICL